MAKARSFLLNGRCGTIKMAEAIREEIINNRSSNSENITSVECAVCLQISVHPAELPCGHIFCYLCIKGIINQGRRCAMCRQEIPVDYLEKPRLLKPVDTEIFSQGFADGHLWFYEGHNGWWQYDERTSLELESAYQKGDRCCDLLIAGFLYIADFDGMLQYRKNDPSRRRRIKRDLATTTKKGIAGLKLTKNSSLTSSNYPEVVSNDIMQNLSVSNSSALNNLSNITIFSSASNNLSQNTEPVQGCVRNSRCSFLTCRPASITDSTESSQTDSSSYPRIQNIDSVIHDTLDWTIEQIESLNLELLNDYETLFRDFNNYEQMQDNLIIREYQRTPRNYMSRYLNMSNPPSDGLENRPISTARASDLSQSNNDVNNSSSESFSVRAEETNPIYSDVTETESEILPLQSNFADLSPPTSPLRNRGSSGMRLRRDYSQHSSN